MQVPEKRRFSYFDLIFLVILRKNLFFIGVLLRKFLTLRPWTLRIVANCLQIFRLTTLNLRFRNCQHSIH
jgi:hypothetical protein